MGRRAVCGSHFCVAGIRIGHRLPIIAILLLAGIAVVGCSSDKTPPTPPAPPVEQGEEQPAAVARGLELFAHHCESCHGDKGTGDGTAAYLLNPKPRDFSGGTFILTSTEMGLPSDEDLLKTLSYGMPGSAMPPWSHLPKEDLEALVQAVRHLALEDRGPSADRAASTDVDGQAGRRFRAFGSHGHGLERCTANLPGRDAALVAERPYRRRQHSGSSRWHEVGAASDLGRRHQQRSPAWTNGLQRRRQSVGRLSRAWLGEDLSRPVPVRLYLFLGLLAQRYAFLPLPGLRAQRGNHPAW